MYVMLSGKVRFVSSGKTIKRTLVTKKQLNLLDWHLFVVVFKDRFHWNFCDNIFVTCDQYRSMQWLTNADSSQSLESMSTKQQCGLLKFPFWKYSWCKSSNCIWKLHTWNKRHTVRSSARLCLFVLSTTNHSSRKALEMTHPLKKFTSLSIKYQSVFTFHSILPRWHSEMAELI